MELTAVVKRVLDTQTVGSSGFRKRELHVTTNEQYPQILNIEFVQDKVDLLDAVTPGEEVTVSINLRGREWVNPEGEVSVFNQLQGWKLTTKDPLAN